MEVITWAALAFLVGKMTTVIKAIGKNNNMVFTQIVVWVLGVVVVWIAGESNLGGGIVFSGLALSDMNFGDFVLAGTSLGSTMSVVYDFKKARDGQDSATEPALLPSASPKVPSSA